MSSAVHIFIPIRKTRMIRIARMTEITKMTLMNRVTVEDNLSTGY